MFALKRRRSYAFQSRFSREIKHVILEEEEEENHDRTLKPVACPQRRAQQFVIGDDGTESDLLLGSKSFLNRVMIKCEKSQNEFPTSQEMEKKHSMIFANVHDCHNGISSIHGKELPEQLSILCKHNRSHT